MYHYDPQTALDELKDEILLPSPVHVRDMMIRSNLAPNLALELNRKFQSYLSAFGTAESAARSILEDLAGAARKS
jgi:hypothetical protein